MARAQDERSLGELFAELSRETGVLVRKEVELATTELTAKARTAATHVGTIAAGGALAHAGLLVLLAVSPGRAALNRSFASGFGSMLTPRQPSLCSSRVFE